MQNQYISRIKKLKADLLMKTKSKSKSKSKKSTGSDKSGDYFINRNKELGINFEENIRNILRRDYKWKSLTLDRKFYYCEIKIDDNLIIITDIVAEKIIIEEKEVLFEINKDKSLNITIDDKKETIKTQSPYIFQTDLLSAKILVNGIKEMELDGLYDNFDFKDFDGKEVVTIYQNFKLKELSSYNKVVLEIKFNRDKCLELLEQLKRDKKIIENYYKDDKVLYLGIINHKSVTNDMFQKLKEENSLNFIILGIKSGKFSQKEITQFYDWKVIEEADKRFSAIDNRMKGFEDRMKGFEDRMKGFEDRMKGFEDRMKGFEDRMKGFDDKLINIEDNIKKILKVLQKKRRRTVLKDKNKKSEKEQNKENK